MVAKFCTKESETRSTAKEWSPVKRSDFCRDHSRRTRTSSTKDERLCAKMEPTWGVDGGTLCDSVVEEAKMPPPKKEIRPGRSSRTRRLLDTKDYGLH